MASPHFNPDNVPEELRQYDQWVIWKNDKHPRKAYDGSHASVSDPDTWCSFDVACASVAAQDCLGVGFVLTEDDPFLIIDLDKVIDDKGNLDPKAREVVERLNSYTEISKSGRGLHIFMKGKKPTSRCRKDHVEIYNKSRYIATTFNTFEKYDLDISDSQESIDWLCEETFGGGSEEKENAIVHRLDVVLSPDAEPPADKFAEICKLKAFKKIWDGKSNLKSMSDCDWKMAMLASSQGWEDQEIANLIIAFRREHGDKEDLKKALRMDYISMTISKARPAAARPTDLGDVMNAEYLSKLYGEILRYDHKKNRWLIWKGHRWEPDRDLSIQGYVIDTFRTMKEDADKLKNDEDRERMYKWASKSLNQKQINSCIAIAKGVPPISDKGDNWDTNLMLIGCKNGVVDLTTGKLRDGTLADRITMSTKIDYDPDAKCPRWEKFIGEIFQTEDGEDDEALVDWIWRALGYSITGETKEHIILLGHGEGANGKSVFFNSICNALGEYSHITPFSTFTKQSNSSNTNDVAAIDRKRFVVSSETQEDAKMNIERLKSLSGGDPISARFLYHEYDVFQSQATVWMFVNHKPDIDDETVSTWRRMRLVPFERQFLKDKADNTLADKLKAEAPGILAWLVRGCLEWQKRGIADVPERVRLATREYRRESDTTLGFLEEMCEADPGSEVKADVLYQAYKAYAKDIGRVLSQNAFGRKISGMKYERRRDGNGRYVYVGLKLKARTLHVNLS